MEKIRTRIKDLHKGLTCRCPHLSAPCWNPTQPHSKHIIQKKITWKWNRNGFEFLFFSIFQTWMITEASTQGQSPKLVLFHSWSVCSELQGFQMWLWITQLLSLSAQLKPDLNWAGIIRLLITVLSNHLCTDIVKQCSAHRLNYSTAPPARVHL